MPISTGKLTTLGQLKLQAERIKQELALYALASSLGSIAAKNEIAEEDLSEALKAVIDGKMNSSDSMTAQEIQQAIATAISNSEHAKFEKVDSVPTAETAEDNVMYLVMNSESGFYDIYALVSGEVVRLDDTSVDLSAIGGALYESTKTSLDTADSTVIENYFTENSGVTPHKGDVFVITTTVEGVEYEQSAYSYDGSDWVAMTGNVDADKVIMRDNITMAGNYTQFGNLTKNADGTALQGVVAGIGGEDDDYATVVAAIEGKISAAQNAIYTAITAGDTNGHLKVNGTDVTVYTHPAHAAKQSGLYKVTVDAEGHVSATAPVEKADITGLGIPAQDTTYSKATAQADGLMSKEHFSKVEGIAEGATKVEASTTPGNIKVNGAETPVVTIATDTEVTEMLNEVFAEEQA